ncbi:hypothetical protein DPMN_028813 [Dreissena polymorpha]|uniref:Uncharacterized protein n=1 Tax=Dreissena polymorpha TaxID=45954 RepID=A0A9D4RFB5_DREPO|nr:hypothetical protein DPMN_028417 [Dreissena polymorpha]KAH3865770.1 hypothetical protein DPMN_028813 [Dreissena polymorpha]
MPWWHLCPRSSQRRSFIKMLTSIFMSSSRLVFHASTTDLSKNRILNEFSGDGSVKIVVATVAFGLGVSYWTINNVTNYSSFL